MQISYSKLCGEQNLSEFLIDYEKLVLNFRIPRNFGPPHLHVSGGFEDRGITQ